MKETHVLYLVPSGFLKTVNPMVSYYNSPGASEKVKDKEPLRICKQCSFF